FGDQAANVTNSTSTAITVKSPVFSGTLQQQNCTAPDGTQGTRNAPTSVDVKVSNLGTTCETTVPGGYTYLPADSTCHSSAAPSAPVAAFGYSFPGGSGTFKVQFTDASLNKPTQWSWDFGDGATSIQPSPQHTYSTGGTYTVTLTVANAGGSDSISHDVVVPAP
ncbi:MAG TPA: PKD domain-containing protein, partial [Thermoanaerobaculia bacterium]|nr:PKD domain-containing protein [Thermoanaerobaculia bacterium]